MVLDAICRDATDRSAPADCFSPHACAFRRPGFARLPAQQEQTMLDILMLALGAGLFALAIGYTYVCERL